MKIEMPKKLEGRSFFSEVYETTTRQCFPHLKEDPKDRWAYVFFFFPLFFWAFIFIAMYKGIQRLFKK